METLTFPILASAAIALWTVANCVGIWARHLDSRIALLQLQSRMPQGLSCPAQTDAPSGDDSYDVDIVGGAGDVDILPEEPPMQQAA